MSVHVKVDQKPFHLQVNPLSSSRPSLSREAIAPRCAEGGCISKLVLYSSICDSGGGSERVYSGKRLVGPTFLDNTSSTWALEALRGIRRLT